ncbi:MAG TPA: hypothetical protein VFR04_06810 [Solirubrobacterales bacterium]|nr:hypothetical protein [Solirubrobacterales bacterium]
MDPADAAALAREAHERMDLLEEKGFTAERIAEVSAAAAQVSDMLERLKKVGIDPMELAALAESGQTVVPAAVYVDDGPSKEELASKIDALAERVTQLEARQAD